MKKVIVIACLFAGLMVYAQTQSDVPLNTLHKPVNCGATKEILTELITGDYKEKPFWTGNEPATDTKYVLMVNEKSKSWTILQYEGASACILGSGVGHKQVFYGPEV